MPNSASAKKRLRQNVICRDRNKSVKSSVKTQVKKVLAAVSAGEIETAEQEFRLAAKRLDQAGAKGVMHKNAAGRKKSRLQRAIKAAKSG
jgi:small subunit ribosomal protein S20